MRLSILVLVAIVLTINLSNALADENRNFFPMGEKELFSGNTGTGGIGSAAASYFNPGALTQIKENKFSVSATAFYYYSFEGKPMVNIDGEDQNYNSSSFTSAPSSIISVYNFSGFTGAFSIIAPFNEELENQQVWTTSSKTIYYQEKQEDNNLWVGLSLAKDFGNGWSLGASAFAVKNYSLNMSSLYQTDTVGSANAELQTRRTQVNTWGASAIVGIMKEFDTLSIGLKAQSPVIQFMGNGDYYNSAIHYDSGVPMYGETIVNKKETPANYSMPADFSIGVNYHLTDSINILADVSLQLGSKYDQFEDAEVIASNREDNEVKVNAMYRGNLGVEYMPTDRIDILAGIYYVPSAAPSGSEQLDAYGVTIGGYYATQKTKSGLGLFALQMKGEAEIDESTEMGKRTFTSYGGVLSTSYSF